jgi:hypothetical protein
MNVRSQKKDQKALALLRQVTYGPYPKLGSSKKWMDEPGR